MAKKGVKRPVAHTKDSFTVADIDRLAPRAGIDGERLDLLKRSLNTSYADLAERTGWELGTVKSRLARARKAIANAKAAEAGQVSS